MGALPWPTSAEPPCPPPGTWPASRPGWAAVPRRPGRRTWPISRAFAGGPPAAGWTAPDGVDRLHSGATWLPLDTPPRPRHRRPQGGCPAVLLLLVAPAGSPRLRPGPRPRAPSGGGRLPRVLSGAEVAGLLDVDAPTPVDRRDVAVLELLYAAGLRVSELCGLDRGDSTCAAAPSPCSARAASNAGSRSTTPRPLRYGPGSRAAGRRWTGRRTRSS